MDDNWGYVIAGYTVTAVSLTAYVAWLHVRLKRAKQSLPAELDD
jgi:hypothetical protein